MAGASFAGQGRKAGSGQALTVDLETLFAELQASPRGPEGLTSGEVCELVGYCRPKTRTLIMAAQNAGWCRPVRVQRVGIDGVPRMVQGYVFELPLNNT